MRITSPKDPGLTDLCHRLAELATDLDRPGQWPAPQLQLLADYGVFEWFIGPEHGGQGWSDADVILGYLALSKACLTTTFVVTQFTGACRRIAVAENPYPRETLLNDLVAGRHFATVGISHLTTSRRHLAQPVLRAEPVRGGFQLDGFSPWVTGSTAADYVVTGATLQDDRQILVVLPTDCAGVTMPPPPELVGLSASQTGQVRCEQVFVDDKWLLAGPVENVMQQGVGAKTGGLQTSTLAIGLADACVDFLEGEAAGRPDLLPPAERFRSEWKSLRSDLLLLAEGREVCSNESVRGRANSLVLRSSQAALSAAKGTGFVIGHPAGRWCREALFFLVWSCPQPVMAANLCELAGLSD